MLTTIVARAVELSGSNGGAIFEYDAKRELFVLRATHGVDEIVVKALQAEPVRLGEGAVGRAAVERIPMEFSDIEADAYESRLRSLMTQAGFRSVLNVPLLREERIFGGLSVCRNSPGRFPTQVVDLLRSFATQSVLAIQNARLFKEIDEWSRTLERRVNEQLAQLERLSSLKRFFSPQLAEAILSGSTDNPLASHRREVVVVFLDLRGFTAFAGSLEPEEVMGVLREYHAEMGKIVLEHEGTLERFTGDGMMIFFNDPVLVPNPAERALRMAMTMRDRADKLAISWRKRGLDLSLGIGIVQGYATIGAIGFEGRVDYGAVGTVTNLAARLCSEAKGGQILTDRKTLSEFDELVETEPIGELNLKGFSKPISAFSITSLRCS